MEGFGGCISNKRKYFFLTFFSLFLLILTFSTYFLASISHVLHFYKLICDLQWGTHTYLADGKANKNKLMAMLLMWRPGAVTILPTGDEVSGRGTGDPRKDTSEELEASVDATSRVR